MAQARADWLAGVGADFVAYTTALAEADGDSAIALRSHQAAPEEEYATHLVTFLGDTGAADGTLWANSTSASLGYQQGWVDRGNTVLDAYAGADKTYAIASAQAMVTFCGSNTPTWSNDFYSKTTFTTLSART